MVDAGKNLWTTFCNIRQDPFIKLEEVLSRPVEYLLCQETRRKTRVAKHKAWNAAMALFLKEKKKRSSSKTMKVEVDVRKRPESSERNWDGEKFIHHGRGNHIYFFFYTGLTM